MTVSRTDLNGCVVLKPDWGRRVADERALWRSMVTFIALVKGYQNGWVAHQYKDKFGDWPPDRGWAEPEEPTEAVQAEIDAKIAEARRVYRKARLAEKKQNEMA